MTADMAPAASGIRDIDQERSFDLNMRTLDLASVLLKKHGSLVMKSFQGKLFEDLMNELHDVFASVKIIKPKTCRKESSELFVLARKLQQPAWSLDDNVFIYYGLCLWNLCVGLASFSHWIPYIINGLLRNIEYGTSYHPMNRDKWQNVASSRQ